MDDTVVTLSFDYKSLDPDTAQFVQQQTSEIKNLFRQSIENILRIGQNLLQVKDRLPHGQWLDWLEAEFKWTDRTAWNYMRAAKEFKSETVSDLDIAAKALYTLSWPSTPNEAREEAIARAQAGEKITPAAARELRDKYAPSKSEAGRQGTPPESVPQTEPDSQPPQPDPSVQPPTTQVHSAAPSSLQALPRVEPKAVTPVERQRVKVEKPLIVAPKRVQPGEWWKLGDHNYLYCGDPASAEFQEQLPKTVSFALASPPELQAWPQSIPVAATSVASIFSPYHADQDLSLVREIVDRYLQLYTDGGDVIVLLFLPDPAVLPLIKQLGCDFFCADPDLKRCDAAITVWATTGQKAEKVKTRKAGKKHLPSLTFSRQ